MVSLKRLLVLMVVSFLSLAHEFTGTLYKEVVSTFPDDLETKCYLASYGVSSKVSCAALCDRKTACKLFCMTGTSCRLYSAWVTGYWNGIAGGEPKARCYSSWEDKNNIASHATLAASTTYNDVTTKNKGNDGFYCNNVGYCYFSEFRNNPWWSANLGSPHAISSVKLITRRQTDRETHFDQIEVRVGNSTTNFRTSNLLLGKLTKAVHGAVYTFTAQRPITGSVISVQRVEDNVQLMFCEIQIIYV